MGLLRYFVVLLPALLAFVPHYAQGKILYVSPDGHGTNGLTWGTAFSSIASALAVSASGDRVWVSKGTYEEAVVVPNGVGLYGGFDGSENEGEFELRRPNEKITHIDGSGLLEASPAIRNEGDVVIDGFHVENGSGGSAVSLEGGTFKLAQCRLFRTASDFGGGLAIFDATGEVDRCVIVENIASEYGAGMDIVFATVEIRNTIVAGNQAYSYIDHFTSTPVGGAGAGLTAEESSIRMVSCLFDTNWVGRGGTGNNIAAGVTSDLSMINCIIDVASPSLDVPPNMKIAFSNIWRRGMPDGEGNIFIEPEFLTPPGWYGRLNYHLKPSSRGIDEGTATGVVDDLDGNPRPADVRGRGIEGLGAFDMGPYEFQLSPADLDSNGYVNFDDLLLFRDQWHGPNR